MKALVTGGAGFIGSNIVDALLARGDEVTVLDDLSTGKRENLEQALENGAQLEEIDVRDAEAVSDVVGRVKPDVIFHLAAQIDVRKSVSDPANDARVNVEGTVNVLSAAQKHGVPRVVNTSTGGAIYGEGRQIPAPEDHPVAPEAPYGLSKFCAEQYCEIFTRLHGLSTVSLRYGNVYGPRQDPLGEAGVVAIFCGKLLEGGEGHDLRQRRADARLRVRRGRGGRQPARRRVRRHAGRSTSASASRRACSTSSRCSAISPTTASTPSTPPSAPARCSTSRSTPRARVKRSAGRPRSSSTRASAGRSTACASTGGPLAAQGCCQRALTIFHPSRVRTRCRYST